MTNMSSTFSPAEARAAWTTALRSGEYKQGRDRLATIQEDGSTEFCCLGVACDLAVQAGIIEPPRFEDGAGVVYGNSTALLPEVVRDWLGLRTRDGYFNGTSLANENDRNDRRTTFTMIADIIDAEPEWLIF